MISNEKDQDTTPPSPTSPASETPFSDGLEKELKPPVKAPTKKVKARRLKR